MQRDVINLREYQFDDFEQKGTKFRATIEDAMRVAAFQIKPSGITIAQMKSVRVYYNGRAESYGTGAAWETLQTARGKGTLAADGFLEIPYVRDFQKDVAGMLSTLLNIGGLYASKNGTKLLEKVEIEIETTLSQAQADAATVELFGLVTDTNPGHVQQVVYRFQQETETTQKDLEDKHDLFLNPREDERAAISRLIIDEAVANISRVRIEVNGRDWIETTPALNSFRGLGKSVDIATSFVYDTHLDGIEGTIPLSAMPVPSGDGQARGELVNKAELMIDWAAGNRPATVDMSIEYLGML